MGLLVILASSRVAHATVLWRGDFETGDTSQWTKTQVVSPDRIQIVTSPVHQGSYAARVEVRQGDDPIDASGNRSELVLTSVAEEEGNERYYKWSTLWPSNYPYHETWQLFTQWHHSGNSGSPPLELYVYGSEIRMRVHADTVLVQIPLELGRWHEFVLHVKWSSDPAVGFVELWYDGEHVLPLRHAATLFPGMVNYLKQGLYRNESIPEVGIVYHDGMMAATALEDVFPSTAPGSDAGVPDGTASAGCSVARHAGGGAGGAAGALGMTLGTLGVLVARRRRSSATRAASAQARDEQTTHDPGFDQLDEPEVGPDDQAKEQEVGCREGG